MARPYAMDVHERAVFNDYMSRVAKAYGYVWIPAYSWPSEQSDDEPDVPTIDVPEALRTVDALAELLDIGAELKEAKRSAVTERIVRAVAKLRSSGQDALAEQVMDVLVGDGEHHAIDLLRQNGVKV